MAKLYFGLILTFFLTPSFGQSLAQITIGNRGSQDIITFLVDESVVVNMTTAGKFVNWVIERTYQRSGIYPILEKYMGKEEYYPSTDTEA